MEKVEFFLYLKKNNDIKICFKKGIQKVKEEKEKIKEEMYEKDEEERKNKLFELEKQLGRHNNSKEEKEEKDRRLMKYFLIATNMMYTLAGPIILMLGFYMFLKIFLFKEEKPILLVIFLFVGAFTGYWALIKQVTNIK